MQRVLYIRHKRTVEIAENFRANQDEWIEALSLHADVTLINDNFDMAAECDRLRPDFILYESPGMHPAPLVIANPLAHPEIPRLAFMMQDPTCGTRVNFLRLIDELNIRWVFTHMTEAALRQSPELKARVFSLPLLFDENVFRDYGVEKDIPVSIFGGFMAGAVYHWRATTGRKISERFPTLVYKHPGYLNPVPRHAFQVTGEAFARFLSRSHFSLADSTGQDFLVRKHLEIPASGAVLVSPDTAVLRPYGFRDMENCLLGEGEDLCRKIAAVADDPALFEKIRKNGHDLVHGRYGRKSWRQLLNFVEVLRGLKPGETIIQRGLLGKFETAPDQGRNAIDADYPDSDVSAQLRIWHDGIISGEIDGDFKTPDWFNYMTEGWVLLGVMALSIGDLAHATQFFLAPQSIRKKLTGFGDWDPEEIAWLSLTASLTGDGNLLEMTKRESTGMRHLSLRRMQWLGHILGGKADAANPPADATRRADNDRLSIHWTGQMKTAEWVGVIDRILKANGQTGILRS